MASDDLGNLYITWLTGRLNDAYINGDQFGYGDPYDKGGEGWFNNPSKAAELIQQTITLLNTYGYESAQASLPFVNEFYSYLQTYRTGGMTEVVPSKLYMDTSGNFLNAEGVSVGSDTAMALLGDFFGSAEAEGMTPYQQAQIDLAIQQLQWEQQQAGTLTAAQQAQLAQAQQELASQTAQWQANYQLQQQQLGLEYGQYLAGLQAQPSNWIERWYAEHLPAGATMPSGLSTDYSSILGNYTAPSYTSSYSGGTTLPTTQSWIPQIPTGGNVVETMANFPGQQAALQYPGVGREDLLRLSYFGDTPLGVEERAAYYLKSGYTNDPAMARAQAEFDMAHYNYNLGVPEAGDIVRYAYSHGGELPAGTSQNPTASQIQAFAIKKYNALEMMRLDPIAYKTPNLDAYQAQWMEIYNNAGKYAGTPLIDSLDPNIALQYYAPGLTTLGATMGTVIPTTTLTDWAATPTGQAAILAQSAGQTAGIGAAQGWGGGAGLTAAQAAAPSVAGWAGAWGGGGASGAGAGGGGWGGAWSGAGASGAMG